MLRTPTYAGFRVRRGVIVGQGTWAPLIAPEDWRRLQDMLGVRGPAGESLVRYLLTGIATCGECGAGLRGGAQTAKRVRGVGERSTYPVYVCPRGFHVAVHRGRLDAMVSEAVLDRMERADFVALLGRGGDRPDPERVALVEEIEAYRAGLEEVCERAARTHDVALLFDAVPRIRALVEDTET